MFHRLNKLSPDVLRITFAGVFSLWIMVHFLIPEMWGFTLGLLYFENYSPFLDMQGRTAAYEAWSMGLDVIRNRNPLDPLHRFSAKPSWGYPISSLGMYRAHYWLAGSLVVASTVGVILSIIRPRRWKELLMALLIVGSPAVMLGIERANDDLVYFSLLALLPLALRILDGPHYILAWLLIFLITPAKFYPGAAFSVFFIGLKESKYFWRLFIGGVLFVSAYAFFNWQELLYLKDAVPSPPRGFMVNGLSLSLSKLMEGNVIMLLALLGFVAVIPISLRGKVYQLTSFSLWKRQLFMIGFSVYLFCYVLNTNYDYRFIFLVLLLPFLFELASRDAMGARWAVTSRWILWGLVFICWADLLSYQIGVTQDWERGVENEFIQQLIFIKKIIFGLMMPQVKTLLLYVLMLLLTALAVALTKSEIALLIRKKGD